MLSVPQKFSVEKISPVRFCTSKHKVFCREKYLGMLFKLQNTKYSALKKCLDMFCNTKLIFCSDKYALVSLMYRRTQNFMQKKSFLRISVRKARPAAWPPINVRGTFRARVCRKNFEHPPQPLKS